jgi:hypothetical protein
MREKKSLLIERNLSDNFPSRLSMGKEKEEIKKRRSGSFFFKIFEKVFI